MSDLWKIVGFILVLVLLASAVGFAAGWLTWPFDLGSRQNVERQFARGYELYESLGVTAQAVCSAEDALAAASDEDKSQRQSQLTGYQTNYGRIAGDYDAWARNIFEGGIVGPPDLPSRAPSLSAMKTQACE